MNLPSRTKRATCAVCGQANVLCNAAGEPVKPHRRSEHHQAALREQRNDRQPAGSAERHKKAPM